MSLLTNNIRGCRAIVHITVQLSRKTLYGLRLSSMSASWLSLVYRRIHESRRQRRFRRLTFTIVSFGLLCPTVMTKKFLSFPPASRLHRKERYLGVVFSSDSPPSYLFSVSSSAWVARHVATGIVSFSRRKKNCAAVATAVTASRLNISPRRGPSMEIARESKYLCLRLYAHTLSRGFFLPRLVHACLDT